MLVRRGSVLAAHYAEAESEAVALNGDLEGFRDRRQLEVTFDRLGGLLAREARQRGRHAQGERR